MFKVNNKNKIKTPNKPNQFLTVSFGSIKSPLQWYIILALQELAFWNCMTSFTIAKKFQIWHFQSGTLRVHKVVKYFKLI